ncbi:MAG: hypothetical protein R2939_09085 [Kofleriaceae bacterium]
MADRNNRRIRRIDLDGTITTVAGAEGYGFRGDGGPATDAYILFPLGVAVDSEGRIVISDTNNHRVRRVDAAGIITTIAGTGTAGYGGDGGPGTAAQLSSPSGIAVDDQDRVLVTDWGNAVIRRIDTDGTITTIAGQPGVVGFAGDGGPATAATLGRAFGVTTDGADVYIAETTNNRVRRIDAAGTIETVAGDGTSGFAGDGGLATAAKLSVPYGVAVHDGTLVVSDTGNQRLRQVDLDTGLITTIAGTGVISTFAGDGGPASAAALWSPTGLATGPDGQVVFSDNLNDRVRRIDLAGDIATVAGKIDPEGMGPIDQARLATPRAITRSGPWTVVAGGSSGTVQLIRDDVGAVEVVAGRYPQPAPAGDLARYRDVSFGSVGGVAYDADAGRIYLSETSAHRIHVIDVVDPDDARTWTIAPLAGAAGIAGHLDGVAATARLREPAAMYLDAAEAALYVADAGNHVIRRVDLTTMPPTITTIAGTPSVLGIGGDGGPATAALLYRPQALTRCPNGDLFVADTGNHRIRRIDGDGVITTVLGDGVAASSGEGVPAAAFPVAAPAGVACDAAGDVFATSTTTVRALPADADGVVDGRGPVLTIYGQAPRDTPPASLTACLGGVIVVDEVTLRVADACAGLLVELVRERLP